MALAPYTICDFIVLSPANTIEENEMKIIIVGLGKVGQTLAAELSKEDNDITVIDNRESVVQDFASQYDLMGVVGNGATYSVQMDAGIEAADLLIAVTGSDELNLLCCLIAKKAGNCLFCCVNTRFLLHKRE